MPKWLHRTTKDYLVSVPAAKLPEAVENYIEEPDLSAVAGQPPKYWEISGDTVSLADQATQDAIDAAELEASRDASAGIFDGIEATERAFALAVLDEFNLHAARITAILDAIDGASSLAEVKSAIGAIPDVPTRTIAQLKTAIRNQYGS